MSFYFSTAYMSCIPYRQAAASSTGLFQVTYECAPHHSAMEGDPQVTCLSNGSWSALPSCHPDCHASNLTILNNASLYVTQQTVANTMTSYAYMSTLSVSCAAGFIPTPAALITCQADGRWSNDIINCTGSLADVGSTITEQSFVIN